MFRHCFANNTVTSMHFVIESNTSGRVKIFRYLTQEVCDGPDLHAECAILKSNFIPSCDSCLIFRASNAWTRFCALLCRLIVRWSVNSRGNGGWICFPRSLWITLIFVGCILKTIFYAVICEKASTHSCGPRAWVWLFIFVPSCCIGVFVALRFTGSCHRCRIKII